MLREPSMPSTRSLLHLLWAFAGGAAGCGSALTGPDAGLSTFELRVATIGMGLEPDSIAILLDGQPFGMARGLDLVGVGWVKHVMLAPGPHEVRLEGVARNCGQDRTRTVEVPRAGGATHLVLTCQLPLGDLVVLRQTATEWGDLTYVPPGGGSPERLGVSQVTSAAWSPDGTRLAVIAARQGGDVLLLVDRDTGGITELGTDLGPWPADLSWSPDGTTLGYTRLFLGGESTAMLVDADGSNPRPLLDGPAELHTASPVWSPDGASIAFLQDGDLQVLDVASGTVARLTEGRSGSVAAWSPEGDRLAYARDTRIWVVGKGGDQRRLVSEDIYGYYQNPQWLPGGSGLLVERWESYDFIDDWWDGGILYQLDIETGARVQVSGERNLHGARFRPAGA